MMQVSHSVLSRGGSSSLPTRRTRGSSSLHHQPRVVVCQSRSTGREADVESLVEKKPRGMQEHIQAVVDLLLFRAASRVERGVATCLECKGSGQCLCDNCKGGGVTAPMKRSALASGALGQTVRGSASEKGDQWLMTNRCLKCRGRGNSTCGPCDGTGLRAPPIHIATRRMAVTVDEAEEE